MDYEFIDLNETWPSDSELINNTDSSDADEADKTSVCFHFQTVINQF